MSPGDDPCEGCPDDCEGCDVAEAMDNTPPHKPPARVEQRLDDELRMCPGITPPSDVRARRTPTAVWWRLDPKTTPRSKDGPAFSSGQPVGLVCSRERVVIGLEAVRRTVCLRVRGIQPCDCKYGLHEGHLERNADGEMKIEDRALEQEMSGCPELSVARDLLATLTDEEYHALVKRALDPGRTQ